MTIEVIHFHLKEGAAPSYRVRGFYKRSGEYIGVLGYLFEYEHQGETFAFDVDGPGGDDGGGYWHSGVAVVIGILTGVVATNRYIEEREKEGDKARGPGMSRMNKMVTLVVLGGGIFILGLWMQAWIVSLGGVGLAVVAAVNFKEEADKQEKANMERLRREKEEWDKAWEAGLEKQKVLDEEAKKARRQAFIEEKKEEIRRAIEDELP